MKKLALLLTLFLSIGIFFYFSDEFQLIKPLKKACKKGEYSKLEKFFVKKHGYKKYVLDGYEIFKSDYLEDYNYVFTNISSNKDYETHSKFTAIHQIDSENNYHIVFILADLPQH